MRSTQVTSLLLLLLGLSFWAMFQFIGPVYGNYALGLGSIQFPATQFVRFAIIYGILGTAGAVCVAVAMTELRPHWQNRELTAFVPIATLIGVLVPAFIRFGVLGGGAITDDESAYRFSAELLASGRLTAPSHPLRLFFDHAFLVNDGRMFSQYFLGWPAIMALAVPFGADGYLNALISGATVPALYRLVEISVGKHWGRLAVLVFLTSPMLQVAAATQMSHTSVLAALVAAILFGTLALRGGRPRVHAAFGFFLALAFFIRPLSAVGVALPWGALWTWQQMRPGRRVPNILAFVAPVLVLGAVFLWVNAELTGSAFKTAYQRAFEYAADNNFRFTHVGEHRAGARVLSNSGGVAAMLATVTNGLVRLNLSLFGWPASLILLPVAVGLRKTSVWWASIGSYIVLHFWLHDPGIDSFGPTHWFEISLPILVLTTFACQRATRWAGAVSTDALRFPAYLVGAFMVASVFLFSPYRLKAVSDIGEMSTRPLAAVAEAGLRDAIVFADRPWAMRCVRLGVAPNHYVYWWPLNDPDFENSVLWANHLSLEADRALLKTFPGRTGYVTAWNASKCAMALIPLERAPTDRIPNGIMRSKNGSAWRYTDDIPVTGQPVP
ncbi:MAG: hypothetical protein WBG86_02745 [Polyangiales bacterium]